MRRSQPRRMHTKWSITRLTKWQRIVGHIVRVVVGRHEARPLCDVRLYGGDRFFGASYSVVASVPTRPTCNPLFSAFILHLSTLLISDLIPPLLRCFPTARTTLDTRITRSSDLDLHPPDASLLHLSVAGRPSPSGNLLSVVQLCLSPSTQRRSSYSASLTSINLPAAPRGVGRPALCYTLSARKPLPHDRRQLGQFRWRRNCPISNLVTATIHLASSRVRRLHLSLFLSC